MMHDTQGRKELFYRAYAPSQRERGRRQYALNTAPTPVVTPPDVMTLDTLLQKDLAEIQWTITDILPVGVVLLTGLPETGKSRLALSLALSVASGEPALDRFSVHKGDVLYVALEESQRRMQDRLRKMLQGKAAPPGFKLALHWNLLSLGGLADLEEALEMRPETRLVVIDTLAKVHPTLPPGGDPAELEEFATVVTPLREIASSYHVTVLLLHHQFYPMRSMQQEKQFPATGSQLLHCLDSVMVLRRDQRQGGLLLHLNGRDFAERELALPIH